MKTTEPPGSAIVPRRVLAQLAAPVLVLALAVAGPGCTRSDTPTPTPAPVVEEAGPLIRIADSTDYRLVLPSRMERVLRDSVPGFEPWPMPHYPQDLRDWFVHRRLSHRSAPSAVIGDWNGDGIQDLVVEGHDQTRSLRLCLLSTGDGFTLLRLRDTRTDPSEETPYLVFQAPGLIESVLADTTISLRADAFQVAYFGKTAKLYYWNGTGFAGITTAD